ncbi:hypothetical protein [Leptospira mtsangambouensis]|uniref:hypothetical protein n=1 Tax=Leptospira mtsangambouensis TaxID=2484912 RepID=UPI001EE9E83E|nr:hypothetical protein [Leptospira mtsangambouensis]MCG6142805.1 hypothetical protein [Leptospira mtsangambouensis]
MKNYLLCLTLSLLFLNSEVISESNNTDKKTKIFLTERSWYRLDRLTTNIHANYFTFYDDNTYRYNDGIDNSYCPPGQNGRYILKENQITLFPASKDCWSGVKSKMTCLFNKNSNHPFFPIALECSNGENYQTTDFFRKNGSQISLYEIDFVEVFIKDFKVTSNLKRRRFPDQNSEIIFCIISLHAIWMKYIPKGAIFHAFARTSQKDQIDGVEDYWYFGHSEYETFPGYDYTVETITGSSCAINGEFRKEIEFNSLFNHWVFGKYLK